MKPADSAAFAAILHQLGELFSCEISIGKAQMYFRVLERFTIGQIQRAANTLAEGKFFPFPLPADFIEAIEGSSDDRSEGAWSLLITALSRYSGNASLLVEDDGAFVQALERTFGSWISCADSIGSLERSDPMFANQRKHFIASYRIALKEALALEKPVHLVGRYEAENRLHISQWVRGELLPQTVAVLRGHSWQEARAGIDPHSGRLLMPQKPNLKLLEGGGNVA